jgi:hypothetical protein
LGGENDITDEELFSKENSKFSTENEEGHDVSVKCGRIVSVFERRWRMYSGRLMISENGEVIPSPGGKEDEYVIFLFLFFVFLFACLISQ